MRLRVALAGLGLALVLGGAANLPVRVFAQDAASESGKRKVRARTIPEYPALARQMNVSGKVKIEADVAADGRVVKTKVVGGSPLLVNAALDAIKKWRFEPAPRDTTELVEFEFNGRN